MVDEPEQNESVPLITGVAGAASKLVLTEVGMAEQPAAFFAVTEKVPAVVTEILWVVAPVDQR